MSQETTLAKNQHLHGKLQLQRVEVYYFKSFQTL